MKAPVRTEEERRAAVAKVRDGVRLVDVATEFGVSVVSIGNWCKAHGVKPGPGAWIGSERRTRPVRTTAALRAAPATKAPRKRKPVPSPAERDVPRRRFTDVKPLAPERVAGLDPEHPAIAEARTLFPSTVVPPSPGQRVLVSGANNRKLGDRVVKGAWSGMPIFHLTLEERATCPRSCHAFGACYGNGMQMAKRHAHGPALEAAIDQDLRDLARAHPAGFVVRIHTLGDFYSIDYVHRWARWLVEIRALHVFGYTAWPVGTAIGDALRELSRRWWDRFAMRFSGRFGGPAAAVTIDRMPEGPTVAEGVVCPAQTGATGCCGECGLCWAEAGRDETIVFVLHGQARRAGPDVAPAADPRAPRPSAPVPPGTGPAARNPGGTDEDLTALPTAHPASQDPIPAGHHTARPPAVPAAAAATDPVETLEDDEDVGAPEEDAGDDVAELGEGDDAPAERASERDDVEDAGRALRDALDEDRPRRRPGRPREQREPTRLATPERLAELAAIDRAIAEKGVTKLPGQRDFADCPRVFSFGEAIVELRRLGHTVTRRGLSQTFYVDGVEVKGSPALVQRATVALREEFIASRRERPAA